jgi:hypothetical protein
MPFDTFDEERKRTKDRDSVETEPKQRKKDPSEDAGYWPDAERDDQEPIRDDLR